NGRDLPFAAIYMAGSDGAEATLAATAGMTPGHAAAPATLAGDSPWPVREVIRSQTPKIITDFAGLAGQALPTGPWSDSPRRVAGLPIRAAGETGRPGALVVGLNPFRLFDDNYRSFLGLVAGQISAALANAQSYEEERKRAEALAEIDRAKTTFFSNASHEF